MWDVVIVEDDAEQARLVERLVAGHARAEEFRTTCLPDAPALEAYLGGGGRVDILVMDIRLGDGGPTGIDVVRQRFPRGCDTQVVYITGYVEYCTPVYQTEHVYFLVKPVRQEDVDAALDRALENLDALAPRRLAIRSGGKTRLVPVQQVAFVESNLRKVRVCLADGESLETYATLAGLLKKLPPTFVQCHKSFLVNMDHIAELRPDCVVLQSGDTVPISQARRKATREAFLSYARAGF